MRFSKYILNLPWTIIAIALALLSLPTSVRFDKHAIIINIRKFWWHPTKGLRALTLGNVILLGDKLLKNDLYPELVHINQHMHEPFVHPFLAAIEVAKHGFRDSKYEREAYEKASNKFVE